MERKVICFIQAFDCEHTIARTMQSIADQTYKNWFCFVLSNGNKDDVLAPNHSFDVIRSVASRDRRFVVLTKKRNSIDMYIPSLYRLASMFPEDFICSLDADDVYEPDFFERAVRFAEQEQLDIVCCGTRIMLRKNVEAADEREIGKRKIDNDTVILGEAFTQQFRSYRTYFNEMWGKLYRAKLFSDEKYSWAYAKKNFFGRFLPDTLFTFDTLSRCDALGILSGTSHKFYQFEQRKPTNATVMANEYTANRQKMISFRKIMYGSRYSIYDTYEYMEHFLKCHGKIGKSLHEYLQAILVGWLYDIYNRTLVSTADEKKLVEHAERIILNPRFDRLMRYRGTDQYDNLKGYRARKEYCILLRNTLAYQPAIHNREKRGKTGLPCSHITAARLERVIEKLDKIIVMLERKQGDTQC